MAIMSLYSFEHSFCGVTLYIISVYDHLNYTIPHLVTKGGVIGPFVRNEESAVRRTSSKQVRLKISQYSQENSYVGVSF